MHGSRTPGAALAKKGKRHEDSPDEVSLLPLSTLHAVSRAHLPVRRCAVRAHPAPDAEDGLGGMSPRVWLEACVIGGLFFVFWIAVLAW